MNLLKAAKAGETACRPPTGRRPASIRSIYPRFGFDCGKIGLTGVQSARGKKQSLLPASTPILYLLF